MSVRTSTFLHTCHFRTQVRGASVAMRLKLAQVDTLFDTQEPRRLQIRELCSLCTHPLVVMLPCCVSPRRLHPSALERMLKTSLCSASSVLRVQQTSFRLDSHRPCISRLYIGFTWGLASSYVLARKYGSTQGSSGYRCAVRLGITVGGTDPSLSPFEAKSLTAYIWYVYLQCLSFLTLLTEPV